MEVCVRWLMNGQAEMNRVRQSKRANRVRVTDERDERWTANGVHGQLRENERFAKANGVELSKGKRSMRGSQKKQPNFINIIYFLKKINKGVGSVSLPDRPIA